MNTLKRRLVSGDQAKPTKSQHRKPCADCPFGRNALPGWLADSSPQEWVMMVHGETRIDCHCTTNQQCAGAAIYRANVFKSCRTKENLSLPPNRELVFTSAQEFVSHHSNKSIT